MPVSINMPSRQPQADPLEKLATALNIAKTGFGIMSDMGALNDLKAKRESAAKQQDIENQQKNRGLDLQEQAFIMGKGDEETQGLNKSKMRAEIAKLNAEALKKGTGDPLADEMKQTRLQKMKEDANKSTNDQSNAGTFAKRMSQAEDVLAKLEAGGDDGSGLGTAIQRSSLYPSILESQTVKQRNQAERNFLSAVLRKESGAAISTGEMQEGSVQYFPRPGDGADVLAQKAENRRTAMQGMQVAAGSKVMEKMNAPQPGAAPSQQQASGVTVGGKAIDPRDVAKHAQEILAKRLAQVRK